MIDYNSRHQFHHSEEISKPTRPQVKSNQRSKIDNGINFDYHQLNPSENQHIMYQMIVLTQQAEKNFQAGDVDKLSTDLKAAEKIILQLSTYQISLIERTIAHYYYLQGVSNLLSNNLEIAMKYLLRSTFLREKNTDLSNLARNYSNLTIIAIEMEDFDTALHYFTKTVDLSEYIQWLHQNDELDSSNTFKNSFAQTTMDRCEEIKLHTRIIDTLASC